MNKDIKIKLSRYIELSKKFEVKPVDVLNNFTTNALCGSITTSTINSNYTLVDPYKSNQVKSDQTLIDEARIRMEKEVIDRIQLVKEWYEYKSLQTEFLELI